MKKILLIDIAMDYNCSDADKTLKYDYLKRKPKLGLQYLCSVLEKNGYSCEIIDQQVSLFSLKGLINKITEDKGLFFIGFYSHSLIKDKLVNYIKKIKEVSSLPIIVGGPGSIHGPEFLNAGCDIVVHGEGEKTVLEIAGYLRGDIAIEKIKGVSFKQNKEIINTGLPDLIENIDEIPFPNRDKIPILSYYDNYILAAKYPYATMITSRGCPYRCIFCNSPDIWQRRYRVRSVENVIKEVDLLVNRYKIRYIAFLDDIFGLEQEWFKEFCQILINKKYDLRWMCIFHPFSLSHDKEKNLELMKKAGCNLISFGLQSADGKILKNINRSPDEPRALEETICIAKKKAILTVVDFIFGLPGETKDSIESSIKYSLKVKPHFVNFHPILIFLDTPLYSLYKNKNICRFGKDQLIALSMKASRKFYLNPHKLFQIFVYIIRKNPLWLIKSPLFLKAMFDIAGLNKIKNEDTIYSG